MPHALILFDVDGTLLVTGGASSRCIERAGRKVLGERFRWGAVTVGRLDPEIFLGLAERSGIENAAEKLDAYKDCYLAELERDLQQNSGDVKVMPGIREALAALTERREVTIGLLTGNFCKAVMLKLRAAGIDPRLFPIGAFAEDGESRKHLVAMAIRRFAELNGQMIDTSQVILVGDTPRDVECARQTGARVLSVATGKSTLAQLQAEAPDRAVNDLRDLRPLMELIDEVLTSPSKNADERLV